MSWWIILAMRCELMANFRIQQFPQQFPVHGNMSSSRKIVLRGERRQPYPFSKLQGDVTTDKGHFIILTEQFSHQHMLKMRTSRMRILNRHPQRYPYSIIDFYRGGVNFQIIKGGLIKHHFYLYFLQIYFIFCMILYFYNIHYNFCESEVHRFIGSK